MDFLYYHEQSKVPDSWTARMVSYGLQTIYWATLNNVPATLVNGNLFSRIFKKNFQKPIPGPDFRVTGEISLMERMVTSTLGA